MKVRLFIKPFCSWCHKAQHWLDARGVKYETLDVIADSKAFGKRCPRDKDPRISRISRIYTH